MKYALIEVIEREISAPDFFESEEDAQAEMLRRLAEALGVKTEDVSMLHEGGDEYDPGTGIMKDAAWTEQYGTNYDWKIFAL